MDDGTPWIRVMERPSMIPWAPNHPAWPHKARLGNDGDEAAAILWCIRRHGPGWSEENTNAAWYVTIQWDRMARHYQFWFKDPEHHAEFTLSWG